MDTKTRVLVLTNHGNVEIFWKQIDEILVRDIEDLDNLPKVYKKMSKSAPLEIIPITRITLDPDCNRCLK